MKKLFDFLIAHLGYLLMSCPVQMAKLLLSFCLQMLTRSSANVLMCA